MDEASKNQTRPGAKSGFKPADVAKQPPPPAKGLNQKGQNLKQNTRNQGYQQDR